ncbi:reverse transcriptase [Gossypium australe]|uniref:Reverse transcriptase n=1 Tax=Gossypium australe TaxID=47621 RepID=A0A5B6VXJ4_9ROSI|nr:reverse transcriptase [Gossypium australe]
MCITNEMNERLLVRYTEDEVVSALKGMGLTKAFGEHGFPTLFYQKCWSIVGGDVSTFCLEFLNEGMDLGLLNVTNIVLIPKFSHPKSLANFRPISLCNVLYKLITKMIVNQFKDVLELCINSAQSAFVPGMLISDNIGEKGFMALKLDISKAYDKVEWKFLREMMTRMRFDSRHIETIMQCISAISYSVIINDKLRERFRPSPSALIQLTVEDGLIRGGKVSRRGPWILHLLFADDCILFGEATGKGAYTLKGILKKYERVSGQCMNFDKSTNFYSTNTPDSDKRTVAEILGIRSSTDPERYIKLPNIVVLQAIPTYSMVCFLLPKSFCDELESVIGRFWWQKGRGKKGSIGVVGKTYVIRKNLEEWDFKGWVIYLPIPGRAFGLLKGFNNLVSIGEWA